MINVLFSSEGWEVNGQLPCILRAYTLSRVLQYLRLYQAHLVCLGFPPVRGNWEKEPYSEVDGKSVVLIICYDLCNSLEMYIK